MTYIKLRQTQTQIIENQADIEYILSYFPDDQSKTYMQKNTDIPWSQLINEETIIAAVHKDVIYFAKNNLNNIIITNTLFNTSTTLINYLWEEIYELLDDDDDAYEVIDTKREKIFDGRLIVEKRSH